MKKLFKLGPIVCLITSCLGLDLAQALSRSTQSVVAAVRGYRKSHEREIIGEFIELLSIPNVASDTANIRQNASLIVDLLRRRDVSARLLEWPGAPPAVYGELMMPGATRTIVFYAHYDGQPTDAGKWIGSEPWKPVLRSQALESGGTIVPFPRTGEPFSPEGRIYARSASDDKAPITSLMVALDALRSNKVSPTSNIKFFFEGEEEAGSPHLAEIVKKHADLLRADAWIICDGPIHQSGRKQLYFGARGIFTVELTVYGPDRPLHSGHYGNWAPNPAMMLAKLLASMKDDSGRVTVEDFYSDIEPLGEEERRALADLPDYDGELMRQLGLSRVENASKSLADLINLPSLNVDGLNSAYVGAQARTIIPSTATAALDMRLVKGQEPARQVERLIAHIRKRGYLLTDRDPSAQERLQYPMIAKLTTREGGGYRASRTRMDLPIAQYIIQAVQSATDQTVVRMPTLGGSVPLYVFEQALKVPCIGVPIANFDNNQHGENENIRIQNLWDGIEILAAIMTMR